MPCKVHTDRWAKHRCSGCSETFCSDCVVEVSGGSGSLGCKRSHLPRNLVDLTARGANKAAVVGMTAMGLLGVIMGPGRDVDLTRESWAVGAILFTALASLVCAIWAVVAGWRAVGRTRRRPQLRGRTRALFGGLLGGQIVLIALAMVVGFLVT